jgi:type II secretory pathway pseudopilin PulG
MFSLIITIISIALVAALALATLYYGGSSWTRGNAAASAATLTNQGQQIRGAMELYYSKNSAYPASLDELVTGEYLKTVPIPPQTLAAIEPSVVAPALAAGEVWALLAANQPAFMVHEKISKEVCQELNYLNRGSDAIYDKMDGKSTAQCYGESDGPFTFVVGVPGSAQGPSLEKAIEEYNKINDPLPIADAGGLTPDDISVPETKNKSSDATPPANSDPEPSGQTTWLDVNELDFGQVNLNATATRTVTFKNIGDESYTLRVEDFSMSDAWSLSLGTCDGEIAPGASCQLQASFTPTSDDDYSMSSGAGADWEIGIVDAADDVLAWERLEASGIGGMGAVSYCRFDSSGIAQGEFNFDDDVTVNVTPGSFDVAFDPMEWWMTTSYLGVQLQVYGPQLYDVKVAPVNPASMFTVTNLADPSFTSFGVYNGPTWYIQHENGLGGGKASPWQTIGYFHDGLEEYEQGESGSCPSGTDCMVNVLTNRTMDDHNDTQCSSGATATGALTLTYRLSPGGALVTRTLPMSVDLSSSGW